MDSEFGFHYNMSENQVNKIYRKACIKYHPDKISQRGMPITQEVNDTFSRLGNEYEKFLEHSRKNSYQKDNAAEKSSTTTPQPPPPPPQKKKRCCGFCRKPGHTRKTCKEFKEYESKKQHDKRKSNINENRKTYIVHPVMMTTATITISIPVNPSNKVGDVIVVPYFDLSGKAREHRTKIRYEDLMNGRQTIDVVIPLK